MLVAQRNQLISALRGHLAEIGVIAAQGLKNAHGLASIRRRRIRYRPVRVCN
jgi:transposase